MGVGGNETSSNDRTFVLGARAMVAFAALAAAGCGLAAWTAGTGQAPAPREQAAPRPAPAPPNAEEWAEALRALRSGLSAKPREPEAPASDPFQETLDKADDLIRKGDVPSARFWLAATYAKGSPKAAFRLAESYDPGMLAPFPRATDAVRARELYAKALEGGVEEARSRIERIDADAASEAKP